MTSAGTANRHNVKSLFRCEGIWERIRFVLGLIFLLSLGMWAFLARAEFVELAGRRHTAILHGVLFILSWSFCLALMLVHPRFEGKVSYIVNAVYTLLVPVYICLTIEMITARPARDDSYPVKLFGDTFKRPRYLRMNIAIIALLVLLFILVTNSIRVGTELCATLVIAFAIANIYVNDFRGLAVNASDFAVLSTAMDVAGGYHFKLFPRVLQGGVNLLILLTAAGRLSNTRLSRKIKTCALNLAGIALVCVLGHHILFSGYLQTYIRQVSYFKSISTYRHCGVALTFSRSVADAFPQKPESYSPEHVKEITARYSSDPAIAADGVSEANPNIIFIVNEAFSDLHELGDFETTENELAFFDSLTDNCVSGISYASILGSRTANTEFEILTDNSLAFLPYGAVPFQNFIKSDIPSLVRQLEQTDYAGLYALHPCPKTNYNRIHAYPCLGFHDFYDNEDAPLEMSILRTYVTDESCYENLMELYREVRSESDQPVFAYCMTMQNHSPYDVEYENFTTDVHAVGLSKEYPDVDQYLSAIKQSDLALKDFVETLSELDEPTVLLFVGDHQPSLTRSFYREVQADDDDLSALDQYRVPFRIWANYDLEAQTDVVTSMNYLQVLLTEFTGRPRTGYQKFLADLRKEVPVITGNGYIGADGNFYDQGDSESPYYELVEEYACLQYNFMFDEENRVDEFFEFAQ